MGKNRPRHDENMSEFIFDCDIPVAVNTVTKSECRLVPPVKIRSWEDFRRFNDQWDRFCRTSGDIPEEVHFELD